LSTDTGGFFIKEIVLIEGEKNSPLMSDSSTDIEFLKDVYTTASNRYKPRQIRLLLIAEAPPCNLDRFFYFEDVKKQDSLFLEIMGVLYPNQKAAYLASGRDTEGKKDLLETFREDGYWLMDLSEVPPEVTGQPLESCVPDLLQRLQRLVSPDTPIVLIKANVYDLLYPVLSAKGYRVIQERLPFPGSGQQRVFRDKLKKIIASL
jgi:hypothetical protein